MKVRNNKAHRPTEKNARRTHDLLNTYLGKKALSDTWDLAPVELQIDEHDYLVSLHAKVRTKRNYLLNRGDASVNI